MRVEGIFRATSRWFEAPVGRQLFLVDSSIPRQVETILCDVTLQVFLVGGGNVLGAAIKSSVCQAKSWAPAVHFFS
jgi:hypothetical protein